MRSYVTECTSFVFFFKQKTAYEIVSRDWSSDVCSSDLVDPYSGVTELDPATIFFAAFELYRAQFEALETKQIGRASCRERV